MPTLPATDSEIRTRIREFIQANFLLGQAGSGFKDSDSFLDSGIVDSTGVLEIVEFLQDSWGVKVRDEHMVPENLDSIDNLVRYIRSSAAA